MSPISYVIELEDGDYRKCTHSWACTQLHLLLFRMTFGLVNILFLRNVMICYLIDLITYQIIRNIQSSEICISVKNKGLNYFLSLYVHTNKMFFYFLKCGRLDVIIVWILYIFYYPSMRFSMFTIAFSQ